MAGYLQNQSGASWLYSYFTKKGLHDCVPTKPTQQQGAVWLRTYQTKQTKRGWGATRMCTDQTELAKRGLHGCVPTKPNSTTYNETHYRCTLRKRSSRTHFVEEPFKCHQHKCERCHMHCYLKERITIWGKCTHFFLFVRSHDGNVWRSCCLTAVFQCHVLITSTTSIMENSCMNCKCKCNSDNAIMTRIILMHV